MTDAPTTNDATLAFELADKIGDTAVSVNIDFAQVPADTRLQLLHMKARELVNGRPHQALMKFNKARAEYDEKCKADPTFTGEAPAAPDLAAIAQAAIADLYAGKVAQRNRGGAKAKTTKDPVDAVVTQAVIRELFAKRKAENPATKYGTVVKEVGESGIAYLQNRATTLAAGDDKRLKELTSQIDKKYVAPARAMVGVNAKGEATGNDLL